MTWISFQVAAEEVERRLGLTWGMAQKVLLEACEDEEVTWRKASVGGPDVFDTSFLEWLRRKQYPPWGGKQPRILKHLAAMFPNERVPEASLAPRYALKAELLKRDPGLAPLDEGTLKRAIDAYNATH